MRRWQLVLLYGGNGGGGGTFPTLSVKTTSIPQGVVNVAYSTTLNANGGEPPYAWNLASGTLPSGVTLTRDGVLSGTPTVSGGWGFTVAVSDSQQPPSIANGQFDLTINPALAVVTTSLPSDSPGRVLQHHADGKRGLYPLLGRSHRERYPPG